MRDDRVKKRYEDTLKGTRFEPEYDRESTAQSKRADSETNIAERDVSVPKPKEEKSLTIGEISEHLREHEQAMILPHPRGSVTIKHLETRVRELLEAQLETDTGTSLYVTKNTLDAAPTMVEGYNYLMVGPITISDGVTLDIPDGVVLVIV